MVRIRKKDLAINTNRLTAEEAARRGWIGDRVDSRDMGRVSFDYLGGIDFLFFDPDRSVDPPVWAYLVQTTSAQHTAERMRKLRGIPTICQLAAIGCRVLVWAWHKDGRLREEDMTAELAAIHTGEEA